MFEEKKKVRYPEKLLAKKGGAGMEASTHPLFRPTYLSFYTPTPKVTGLLKRSGKKNAAQTNTLQSKALHKVALLVKTTYLLFHFHTVHNKDQSS